MMFVFAFLMVSIFSVSLAEAAKPKKAEKGGSNSALESNLKTYFSEKIPYANITAVKVIKVGDVVSVKRRQVLTNKIIEDLERPVLVNIKGKCKYSDTIINENVKQVLHKNEWGEWALGQGTQTEDSIVSGMLSATFDVQKCPSLETGRMQKENLQRFVKNKDMTVIDTQTNLMWAAKDNGRDIEWADAKSYCDNYRGDGYTGWRMPTEDELAELYGEVNSHPIYMSDCGKSAQLTKLIHLTCSWVWTSETRSSKAYIFGFDDGKGAWRDQSYAGKARVLPVRSKE